MRFANPELLWLLTLLPALAVAGAISAALGRRVLRRFADDSTRLRLARGVSGLRRGLRFALRVVALGAMIVALARPQGGEVERQERAANGADVYFALDISRSMLAPSEASSTTAKRRVEIALRFVDSVVRSLRGDRVGLIVFAGEAYVFCPLTLDRTMLLDFLREISTDLVNVQGTDFGAAIHAAQRSFGEPNPDRARALVILTDGEDHSPETLAAARAAASDGITIHGVVMGSETPVPVPGTSSRYMIDDDGNIVQSGASIESLRAVTDTTGGTTWRIAEGSTGLAEQDQVIATIDAMESRDTEEEVTFSVESEMFPWALLVALALLAMEVMIPEKSARREAQLIDDRFA